MSSSNVNKRVGHLQSLLVFVRPSHATWNLVLRGAFVTAVFAVLALAIGEPKAVLPLTLGSVLQRYLKPLQAAKSIPGAPWLGPHWCWPPPLVLVLSLLGTPSLLC